MIEVILRAVRVDIGSATPLLLLEERDGPRALMIFVGAPEAASISYALQGLVTERPMTHDLVLDIIRALGAELQCVVVSDMIDGTYHAELRLEINGEVRTVSSRPSDAIAIALRSGAKVFVADDVMSEHGREVEFDVNDEDDDVADVELGDDISESDLLAQMRDFLDDVNPEDFLG